MRVIKDLHKKDDGYGISDGWELILWCRSLTMRGVTDMHKCYYIINKYTGHVITSQYKAWNDTVRMIMWLDTIVKPLKEKLGKLMIWFDNCGCHKTTLVDDVIAELGIQIACLPPNMTGVLQVLDLVVNGPLKAHTRNLRGSRIVECFQSYAELCTEELTKDIQDRVLPVFEPPQLDMMQSVTDLLDLMAGGFKLPKFVEGVKRSFVSTGCVPFDESDVLNPLFIQYSRHKICGTMKITPTGTSFPMDTSNTDINVDDTNQFILPINFMLEYDNAMLEYDHEMTDAMNFISNL